jgi:alpha-tubulin suppressor-like RCC1 family protein
MKKLAVFSLLPLFLSVFIAACGNGDGGTGPVELSPTVPVNISAGYGSAAMINKIGVLRAWGDNRNHQISLSDDNHDIPVTIDAPDTKTIWHTVSVGGYHMIAIARKGTDRTLWGWGANESGQAGYTSTVADVVHPSQIGLDTDWKLISAGLYYSTAIKYGGTLWTWGHNQYGQLGYDIGDPDVTTPTRVGTAAGWSFVSAGYYHTLALQDDALYAWGRNTWGQCGNNEYGNNLFEPVSISSGWKQVSAGFTQSAGVKLDGTLWAWGGYNTGGVYLGNGKIESSLTPVQIGTDSDWEMVSLGGHGEFTIALKRDGSLWAWGSCGEGHLGNGTSSGQELSPVEIQQGTTWAYVSAGDRFSVGLKRGNAPFSWGGNGYGQLGVGGNDDSNVPVPVAISSD